MKDDNQWREMRGEELSVVPPLRVYTVQGRPALFVRPKEENTDPEVMLVWMSDP
jgi:hypothetical protein